MKLVDGKLSRMEVNLWRCGPFLVHPSTILDVIPPPKPETFFNTLLMTGCGISFQNLQIHMLYQRVETKWQVN